MRCEHHAVVTASGRRPHHLRVQRVLLARGGHAEGGQAPADDQRGPLRHPRHRRGDLTRHRPEGVRRDHPRRRPEFTEQQRRQTRYQVQVQHLPHPRAQQRVQLAAGGPVVRRSARAHMQGRAVEHAGHRLRGRGVRGAEDQLHPVVPEPPQPPEVPFEERHVLRAGRPGRRVEGPYRLVPGQHRVEAGPQPCEARHLVPRRGGLRDRRVVAHQQHPPSRLRQQPRLDRGGHQHHRRRTARAEDPRTGRPHAAPLPARSGARRSRRSRAARPASIESSTSSSTSRGSRRSASPHTARSRAATAGSNLSRSAR